jgi:hypothetical protein
LPTLALKASPRKDSASLAVLAHGVVFKILGSQKNADSNQTSWYQVKVCGQLPGQSPQSPPNVSPMPSPNVSSGELPNASPSPQPRGDDKSGIGYIPASVFDRVAVTIDPTQVGTLNSAGCPTAVAPTANSSSPVPQSTTTP